MLQNLSPAAVAIGTLRAKKKFSVYKILCLVKKQWLLSFLVIHSENCLLWPTNRRRRSWYVVYCQIVVLCYFLWVLSCEFCLNCKRKKYYTTKLISWILSQYFCEVVLLSTTMMSAFVC